MKQRILFIINPISGTKNKKAILGTIADHLDDERFEYETAMTEYAGHAEELAKAAVTKGIDIVAAVGGDGTVNEVARAVVHSNTALAIIPCGSGNGLARHLQIPMNAAKAIEVINRNHVADLDYGKINEHPFFCTCGMGFDAFISLKFAQSKKRGFMTYIDNTLREGVKYKSETYTITTEEGTFEENAFLIACANASQYGNNAYIAPKASMEDGLMDIIIMKPFSTIEAPQIIMQLFNKTLPSNNHVEVMQARKLHISRPNEGAIHCDGDPMMMGKELDIELFQKSFKAVVNLQTEEGSILPNPIPFFSQMTLDLFKVMNTHLNHMNSHLAQMKNKMKPKP
ncbi:diacylglycerol kinase catalytic region [gut metagenome]|uniref:Diacylglycerol kinase catalytic region n=1 Tax=gut metagenome TaxID=749906 RepID=J9GA94_9ZZZZ